MSKRRGKQANQSKRNQQIFAAVIIGIVVVIAGVLLLNRNGNTDTASAQHISPVAYHSEFENTQHILLDVRTPAEFSDGHIEGAMNIAVETLSSRISEVPTDQPIVVYCRSGNRSAQAVDILTEAGYTNVYDMGGIIDWTAAGYPIVQ